MNLGIELWDQFENVLAHTQKGIELCEKFSRFTKERCAIELDYASKLKKLVKSFLPKKKEEEDDLTTSKGFLSMIKEVNDIAGQHETIAESLLSTVWNGSQTLAQDMKVERKKAMQDGAKHQSALQSQFAQLDKVKKNSERAYREMEKAQESYRKANDDQSLSRFDVDKAKQTSQLKKQGFEQSRHEYAAELQKTNHVQKEHYQVLMPQVFAGLQDTESKRVTKVKGFILMLAEIENKTIPIINRCIEDIVKVANTVNYEKELQLVIDKYKTGFAIPSDLPFEDITSGSKSNATHATLHGTFSGKKNKKRPGLIKVEGIEKEDLSHLPPSQQKRQLTAKIDALKVVLTKESAEREALLKMQDIYSRNTSLGDASAVARQLEEKTQHLNQLGQELKKYEEYWQEASKRLAAEAGGTGSNKINSQPPETLPVQNSSQPKNSESVSLPEKVKKPPTPTKPDMSLPKFTSPKSNTPKAKQINLVQMFPGQKNSLPEQESFDCISDDEFIDGGMCTALYDFDGTGEEGFVNMKAGDELTVVARDEGDGWVHVKSNDGKRGFVPATYIKYND